MRAKRIHEADGQRTYAVIFDKGDEVVEGLGQVAAREDLSGAQLTAVGGFSAAVLGYFDRDRKDYRRIPIDEQVEVLSLVGDIAQRSGEPVVHAHVVCWRTGRSGARRTRPRGACLADARGHHRRVAGSPAEEERP